MRCFIIIFTLLTSITVHADVGLTEYNKSSHHKLSDNKSRNYVSANLKKDLISTRPKIAYRYSRKEGWAYLSFIVGLDGKPKRIVVVDSSIDNQYIEAAKKRLNSFRYHPAEENNRSVISAKEILIRFDKSFTGGRNDGISRGFRSYYNKIENAIANNDAVKTKKVLDKIYAKYTQNLTEQALFSWINSAYFYQKKDWLNYRDNIKITHYLNKDLPAKVALQSIKNLFDWYRYKNQYIDAIHVLSEVDKLEGIEKKDGYLKPLYALVTTEMEDTKRIKIDTTLSKTSVWLHALSRSTISLNYTQGDIEILELRCKNASHQFNLTKITDFILPNDYFGCSILVKGTPGTQITMLEDGNLHSH